MPIPHAVIYLCSYWLFSSLTLHASSGEARQPLGFFEPPFVHPALIEMFGGDISDRHPNVIAFDLDEAQTSNQIAGGRDFAVIPLTNDQGEPDPSLGAATVRMTSKHDSGETTYFEYRADKQATDGTIYLRCYSGSDRGTGTWSHHVAVTITEDSQRRYDDNDQPYLHNYRMLKLISHLPMNFFE